MVGVLVRDQDGIEGFAVFADGRQSRVDLLAAEPRVHQDARALGGDEGGVPRAAAGQNTNSYAQDASVAQPPLEVQAGQCGECGAGSQSAAALARGEVAVVSLSRDKVGICPSSLEPCLLIRAPLPCGGQVCNLQRVSNPPSDVG